MSRNQTTHLVKSAVSIDRRLEAGHNAEIIRIVPCGQAGEGPFAQMLCGPHWSHSCEIDLGERVSRARVYVNTHGNMLQDRARCDDSGLRPDRRVQIAMILKSLTKSDLLRFVNPIGAVESRRLDLGDNLVPYAV